MPEPVEQAMTVETAMKANEIIFAGHPAADTPVDTPADTPVDTPVDTPDVKVDPPSFKYDSQEAAEFAYKEAESLIGKKADEVKREQGRADDLQKQLNDALIKATATKVKEPGPVTPTNTDKMKALLEQVSEIDPDDENYYSKVAEVWGSREDEIQARVDSTVKEALGSYEERIRAEKAKVDNEFSAKEKIIAAAETAGIAAGLDFKKGSNDSELFWAFADKAPEGSVEDQIGWTVNKIKEIKTDIAAPGIKEKELALEVERKAKITQEQNSLLERGGYKPVEKAVPETPLGIGEAFAQLQRRI